MTTPGPTYFAPLHRIDPVRDLPLARAYRANPGGPHSSDLLRLLNRLRWEPLAGRYVLVAKERHCTWWIGRLCGGRGEAVEVLKDRLFHSREDAAWAIFEARWKAVTGQALSLD